MSKLMAGLLLVVMPCMVYAADESAVKTKEGTAAKGETKFDQIFHILDANNSGKLSREEVALKAPALAENFDQIDANHDGGLTKKEIKSAAALAEKRRREFSQKLEAADKDQNGKLSREEATALPNISANFDAIDSNHDGQLVIKEIADYVRAMANTAPAAQ